MALGVERGDRVGIWAPNCAEWTIVQYATAKIGAILVTINPAYRTHELGLCAQSVRRADADRGHRVQDLRLRRRMVEEVRAEASGSDRRGVPRHRRLGPLARPAPTTVTADALRARLAALANTDPINIQYTSGTTGFPKGATLSHRNILNNGYFVTELINLGPDDRLCIPVPFYHCFGMVMGNLGCTTHGATMVIPAPGFDPGGDAGRDRAGTLHRGLRRADHVHRDAEPPRLRRARTCRRCAPGSWRARSARSR